MSVKIFRAAALVLLFCGVAAHARAGGEGERQAAIDIPKPQPVEVSYVPEVFGAVKAKFETSLYDGAHRFNVRNSRIGVRGFASPRFKYAVQIDFSNEGKLSVLDSYVTYFTDQLEITLGQQQYRFSTDLDRGPNSTRFSNRSFLSKFLTTYYTTTLSDGGRVGHTVSSIGSRDLGALVRYRLKGAPLRFTLGAFNGSGTNNPEWDNEINVNARIEIGRDRGLHGAVAHYNGHTPVGQRVVADNGGYELAAFTQRMRMWGGELSYTGDNWAIESEYAQRRLRMDGLHLLHTGHVQGWYEIYLPRSTAFKYIAPLGRWDIGDGVEFMNKDGLLERFSAQRATLGVNFGFTGKVIGTELRIQFEKYFLKDKPNDFARNKLLQDKVTLEVVVSF